LFSHGDLQSAKEKLWNEGLRLPDLQTEKGFAFCRDNSYFFM